MAASLIQLTTCLCLAVAVTIGPFRRPEAVSIATPSRRARVSDNTSVVGVTGGGHSRSSSQWTNRSEGVARKHVTYLFYGSTFAVCWHSSYYNYLFVYRRISFAKTWKISIAVIIVLRIFLLARLFLNTMFIGICDTVSYVYSIICINYITLGAWFFLILRYSCSAILPKITQSLSGCLFLQKRNYAPAFVGSHLSVEHYV